MKTYIRLKIFNMFSLFPAENGKNKTRLKTILYWNEFYGRYDTYDFGFGHEAFLEKNCAVSNCFATKVSKLPLNKLKMFNDYVPTGASLKGGGQLPPPLVLGSYWRSWPKYVAHEAGK